jgi:uncharacterized Zn-binding protein involved in type VI secretion
MGLTVFAEMMGLFHSGSGGKGIAPADVCLSPPPPPAGPVPVPYVNMLQASDLSSGSQTVKIDGEPTALEDSSFISTSSGDEAGTQGGNVITHKTKGKGYFKLWSFTVQIEGKGVDRHGDPIGQNCASTPPGAVDFAAITAFQALGAAKGPCKKSNPKNGGTTKKQKKEVRGGPCWQCGRKTSGRKNPKNFTPDHQPPQSRAWYMGGCHATKAQWKAWVKATGSVAPHCKSCSNSQGGKLANASIKKLLDMNNIY